MSDLKERHDKAVRSPSLSSEKALESRRIAPFANFWSVCPSITVAIADQFRKFQEREIVRELKLILDESRS